MWLRVFLRYTSTWQMQTSTLQVSMSASNVLNVAWKCGSKMWLECGSNMLSEPHFVGQCASVMSMCMTETLRENVARSRIFERWMWLQDSIQDSEPTLRVAFSRSACGSEQCGSEPHFHGENVSESWMWHNTENECWLGVLNVARKWRFRGTFKTPSQDSEPHFLCFCHTHRIANDEDSVDEILKSRLCSHFSQ